jgi:cell division protein FtsQ
MAVFGKRKAGTGSAVLDAPEETYAQAEWPTPEPAPAGMLQRGRLDADIDPGYHREAEEPYRPRREQMRYKLRLAVPKTIAGRILAGTVALVVVGILLGCILGVRAMLMHDPRFTIATSSEIQLTGNQHLTRPQVLDVFGSDLERNIFKVPLAERRADLERLPWVQHATVMRLLPNTIRIAVTERTPVAFVRQGTQIGLVDADGVLLDMPQDIAGDPRYSFPVLTGLAERDPLSVRAARMEVYRKFIADLDASGARNSQNISEVDVSNPEDVKALIASGSTDILVHFGDENFLARYKMFEQNLPQWKTQYPRLASVDTRYENQVVLEMQTGTSVPVSGGDAAPAPTAATPVAAVKPPAKPIAKKPTAAAARKPAPRLAKPARVTLSKQKIDAMLAAARKSTPSKALKQ